MIPRTIRRFGRPAWRRFVRRRAVRRAADPSLRSLGFIVRNMGRQAVEADGDVTAFRAACDAWARHVVRGERSPDGLLAGTGGAGQRDWNGLRRFTARSMRAQKERILRGFEDVRAHLWDTVRSLHQDAADARATDKEISARLHRLREASKGNSLGEIRRELNEAADAIGGLVRQRQETQKVRLESLGENLKSMRDELHEAKREMTLDPMTRLYNRAAFDQHLQRTADLVLLTGKSACLIMIDIDHFKQVNDGYGHDAGDRVLRSVADACVRNFPRRTDFTARYGGEEIAVVLQDVSLAEATKVAERYLAHVRDLAVEADDRTIHVTASAGVAAVEENEDAASWLKRADRALYAAKDQGRDRVVVSEASPRPAGGASPSQPRTSANPRSEQAPNPA